MCQKNVSPIVEIVSLDLKIGKHNLRLELHPLTNLELSIVQRTAG